MTNLWILTEEKPKSSTIAQILNLYCRDFGGSLAIANSGVRIKPLIVDKGVFSFCYTAEGAEVDGIQFIYIMTVSGSSNFLDFLVFRQDNPPSNGSSDNLLMAIEETKTSDDESRNTGVYQRGSKFVFIDSFSRSVKTYMLYNDELEARENKKPSDTSIFGTDILLTLGVDIVGKDIGKWFRPFNSLDELITFKGGMRRPPKGNVPIDITRYNDRIEISGRLAKPADAGNIGHDPNIGALSMISKCIRQLGWDKPIVITQHGVSQTYADRNKKNKFLYICGLLGLQLGGIAMPKGATMPESYWHYEKISEKVASILLHVACEYYGVHGVYHNHAGCERSYFRTKSGRLIALPKKDSGGVDNLYLPDVILYDDKSDIIVLVEGKRLDTLNAGIEEIQAYDSIEKEYINVYYSNSKVERWVSIFGGKLSRIPHNAVLLYLNDNGEIFINENAPACVKEVFSRLMKAQIIFPCGTQECTDGFGWQQS
ncbi:MAG: hypothetical protein LBJ12_03050 [Oscillospiraceae bacterium]|jgi:hypothetical protein|nr:hypothetical protein [Oscillospiraceae bacterium]